MADPFVLAPALCLAGCAGADEELIGVGRVRGSQEALGSSTTMPAAPSVSPSPAPTAPAGLPSSRPVQVDIPALGVSEQTVDLGLEPDGTAVPTGPAPVGGCREPDAG